MCAPTAREALPPSRVVDAEAQSMTHTSDKHHRRSIRLPGYDYTQPGAYFVTLVAAQAECLFGDIADGTMRLSSFGQVAQDEWMRSADIRSEIVLRAEEVVVMPNHLHGIVWIVPVDGAGPRDGVAGANVVRAYGDGVGRAGAHSHAPLPGRSPPATSRGVRQLHRAPRSLGSFIAGYKSAVTKRINQLRQSPGQPVWQRNYWERVVRDDREMDRFRRYIATNPLRWESDQLHPRSGTRR
jgi:REP element-mobilizing transposase RayT